MVHTRRSYSSRIIYPKSYRDIENKRTDRSVVRKFPFSAGQRKNRVRNCCTFRLQHSTRQTAGFSLFFSLRCACVSLDRNGPRCTQSMFHVMSCFTLKFSTLPLQQSTGRKDRNQITQAGSGVSMPGSLPALFLLAKRCTSPFEWVPEDPSLNLVESIICITYPTAFATQNHKSA